MDRPNRPQRGQNPVQNNPQVNNGYNPQMQGQRNQQMQGYNQRNPQMQGINQQRGMQETPASFQNNPNMSAEEKVYYMMEESKKKKKKFIIKLVIGILIAAVACVGIYFIATGRWSSKVTGLEAEVTRLNETIEKNNKSFAEEKKKLEQEIADTTVKEYLPETSLQRVEGSNVPQLWLPEGDFMAPNALQIPGTGETVNDSQIRIGPAFVFKPSDRWLMVSQGTTFELSHPQKIWGKIKALSIDDDALENVNMQNIIKDFFVGYPATTIKYRKIFIDEYERGCMGRATVTMHYEVTNAVEYEEPVEMEVDVDVVVEEDVEVEVPVMQTVTNADGTTSEVPVMETITNADGTTSEVPKMEKKIEKQSVTKKEKKKTTIMQKATRDEVTSAEKEMTINVGFVYMGDYALSFLFVHEADKDASSQELIDLMLKSGCYQNADYSLKLE